MQRHRTRPQPAPADIRLVAMTEARLAGAVALSRAVGWAHRAEDWAMVAGLSEGLAALEGERVVGSILRTPFAPGHARISMVIVDPERQGRGIGRRLLAGAMAGGACSYGLVATEEGAPLYLSAGFEPLDGVRQHQGAAPRGLPPEGPRRVGAGALPGLCALDRAATGLEREGLLAALLRHGEILVEGPEAAPVAYAARRVFGRGTLVGPVIAPDRETALRLATHALRADGPGGFVRIDCTAAGGLSPALTALGLPGKDGGRQMLAGPPALRPVRPAPGTGPQVYALSSQALG
ncbi:GNAT family N-acetyltransferase [Paroceanicella profunda]|nr:GNAT family N-acetyltransferase [Paroceanicella profunda]